MYNFFLNFFSLVLIFEIILQNFWTARIMLTLLFSAPTVLNICCQVVSLIFYFMTICPER